MLIDTDHLHFWMQAIRSSENPHRTLDAFWKGQISSKEWLIESLRAHVLTPMSVDIHGGWVGVLASMLFQSGIPVTTIRSIDIDPTCEPIANMMNKQEEMDGRFTAVTSDMCAINSSTDIIVNTSCEHITQTQYDSWLAALPKQAIIVVQSNNYNIPEHIRTTNSLQEFESQSNLRQIWSGSLVLPLYTRYMIIGTSNV